MMPVCGKLKKTQHNLPSPGPLKAGSLWMFCALIHHKAYAFSLPSLCLGIAKGVQVSVVVTPCYIFSLEKSGMASFTHCCCIQTE